MVMTKVEVSKVAPCNYTPEMVQVLRDYAPVNYEKAKIIGGLIKRSAKSVVSKCKSEGIEYVSMPAKAKKVAPRTKAETVSLIEKTVGTPFAGLQVAPVAALNKLLTVFETMMDTIEGLEYQVEPEVEPEVSE